MARQVRSEATRRKLLDAAIDVFGEVGYVAAGRTAIIERAGVTKGALYHHFDSMESLVVAIIEGGFATMLHTFRGMCQPSSPALEGMIHGMFAVTAVLATDKEARAAGHLVFALSESNDLGGDVAAEWAAAVAAQTARAIAEGDLREDLDPAQVAESITGAMLGTWLLSRSGDGVGRLTRMWELLLPAIVAADSLSYFQQFLAREALRYQASPGPEVGDADSAVER
ncbi:TetR family transcriptional regulator [Mycolicibacter terrae]|jgi:AcrR family transcriptional regulator|uniref:TetR family transcriptional regulator n=1 Tax=Mycolicibacter terrae TaxID=1788 RepID=A0AAD1MHW2_9MYCO|nr:TetR/AcrR family transcriptional regulator [Mycolicibacter terrae]ORW92517.1 spore coat protein CotS [Mycolicibacter terrae]BBX23156.1 TetR family transcriptional regulator [Mycolicibacter terrae]SNV67110.1 TetR family transcriptional regulator [Mycolicibacter terrae]